MDLGAAAEGITAAYFGMLLLCTLAIHLVAVALAFVGSFHRQRRVSVLPYTAAAIVATNHLALLIMRTWHGVVLGCSPVWTLCLAAAVGWILFAVFRGRGFLGSIA